MNFFVILFIGLFVVVFGGIGAYFIARFMKGSLKIFLDKTAYTSNEKITGRIELKAKKEIEGNGLFVALIAEKKVTEENGNGEISTSMETVYKKETKLEDSKHYSAGFFNSLNFEITTPQKKEIEQEISNPTLQKIVNITKNFFGKKLYWKIQTRLDAKGVDLGSSQQIKLTLT